MSPRAVKHTATTIVLQRDPQTRHATLWQLSCGRHASFAGPTYEDVEDQWRKHVYLETGRAPKPMGDKTGHRWDPADESAVPS